jgi:tetratricopeptide (TPR) repeat protein
MKTNGIILLPLFFLISVSCFIISTRAVKEARKDLSASYSLKINPLSPDAIKLLAGEFKGLMADYILLEISSFIGSNKKISKGEWEEVCQGFKQTMKLDPYFQQTYLLAQGILPWDAKKPETAIQLLDISRKHRPWDWRPGYYMAFDYYYFLHDYEKASEAFLESGKIKNAPVLLAVLGGRFAVKGKRIDAALLMLKTMLNDPSLHDTDRKEITERIDALTAVSWLKKAVQEYRALHGGNPPSLQALLEEGFISEMPKNPYSNTFYYNRDNGEVFFDEIR